LDGERIGVDEYFSNGLLFPGDAHGRPEELYRCRCRLRSIVNGRDPEKRRDNTTGDVIGYVDYSTWRKRKQREGEGT
jgi:hypothetical protein